MGRLPRLRRAVVFGAVLAAVLGAAASASRDQSDEVASLHVTVGAPFAPFNLDLLSAAGPGMAAKIEIDVPAGYALGLPTARGANAGLALLGVSDAAGGSSSISGADLSLDDPAAYASDAAAQACAPGAHAAVLSGKTTLATQTLRILVFVDPAAGGGQTLLVCPSGVEGTAQVETRLSLLLRSAVTVPQSTGTFVWRALVTPRSGSTYELRAVSTIPSTLTLTAAYDAKHKRALLRGRALAVGRPLAHAAVVVDVRVGNESFSGTDTETTTSTDGRFSLSLAAKTSSDFTANAEPAPEACAPPFAAPGGCLSQTPVGPDAAFATIFVAGRNDAKRVYTSADKNRAEADQLRPSDLPGNAQAIGPGVHTCDTKHPSEAKLVITGEAQSPLYGVTSSGTISEADPAQFLEISATTRVYKSKADAKAALAAEGTLTTARCLVSGQNTGSAAKSTAAFPQHPATIRAFVDKIDLLGPKGTMELVFVQRGRSLARLFVVGAGSPTRPVALDLARKLAARLR